MVSRVPWSKPKAMKGAALAAIVAMAAVDPSVGFAGNGGFLPKLSSRAARSSKVLSSTTKMAASPLNPPPGKKGGFLRGLQESIEYIVNGDEMIRKYTNEFGPSESQWSLLPHLPGDDDQDFSPPPILDLNFHLSAYESMIHPASSSTHVARPAPV